MDMSSWPSWSVGSDAEIASFHSLELDQGPCSTSGTGATNDSKPKSFNDLRDNFAIGVFRDQDIHRRPVPVSGREENILMKEGVNISLA